MTVDDLIQWDEDRQKWSDLQNDHWCMPNPGGTGWIVAARYGFEDGSLRREFDSQEEAESFYRLFILMRHQNLMSKWRVGKQDNEVAPDAPSRA